MTSWICLKVVFKAKSPIHLGYRQIGILKTTRYYITGRTIWGALTARLTRLLFSQPTSENYKSVGNFVRENILSTYFFPALEKDESIKESIFSTSCKNLDFAVLIPWYTKKSIEFGVMKGDDGSITKATFERLFVGSQVSTQITHGTRSAEEKGIHEIEFINSKVVINARTKNVYWAGYLFINTNSQNGNANLNIEISMTQNRIFLTFDRKEITINELLDTLLVGGEQNYGFGRLKNVCVEPIETNETLFAKYPFELKESPYLEIQEISNGVEKTRFPIIAHLKLLSTSEIGKYYGALEPFVWRQWTEKDTKNSKKISAESEPNNSGLCFVPGSVLVNSSPFLLKIREYGILEYINK